MEKQNTLIDLIEIVTEFLGTKEEEFVRKLESEGLTTRQMQYIGVIRELKNPNFSDLAKKLKISKPSVTAAVEKLTALGYADKIQSDEDRRSFHLHLTRKGEQLVALHDRVHRTIANMIEKSLTGDEIEDMIRLLSKVFKGSK
jgi:DNA-binding MarR family transcriptional regulator